VDARAQLRLYLEQRRDAGDQELVLDTLSVDEVMRLLGALTNRPVETEVPIPSAPPVLVRGPHAALATLDDVAAAATVCTRCALHETATRCVPGEGSPHAKLVCVGEAPGETEDQTGRPFVGRAGQLLTKILAAIDVKREDAFIVNVLKHRPPGNRNPLPNEVAACSPFLVRQIELLKPKVILALGTFAAQTLLESKLSIGKLRGTVHRYHGVPLIVTYHPAALLRNPHWKRPAWEDVQHARRLLDADAATDGA
jgi:uracil-DNA glycosylase